MKFLYAVFFIFLAGGLFVTAQAAPYNPSTIVNVNGVPTLIGPCQSVVGGENGTPQRIINEHCPPSTGPWIHPNAVGPRVTGIPLDATYYADLKVAAALKKKNDADALAVTRMMEGIMQNSGRRARPAYAPRTAGTTQSQESSSGGSTQTNIITLCRFRNQRSLCLSGDGCHWDPRGRGRCYQ